MLLLVTIPSSPAAESKFKPTSSAVGLQPRGRGAGTSGSPGAPGSPSSPLHSGDLCSADPRLGVTATRSRSHTQSRIPPDSAVASSPVAPARHLCLAGPGCLGHDGARSREGQRREEGAQQGGDSLGAAREGEEERRKRRAGEELRQRPPPPPGPRAPGRPRSAPRRWRQSSSASRLRSARHDALLSLGQEPVPAEQAHAPISSGRCRGC